MDQRMVSSLEREIETAIAKVMKKIGQDRLTAKPSRQICHLMAKAAVTVYEAVEQSHAEQD